MKVQFVYNIFPILRLCSKYRKHCLQLFFILIFMERLFFNIFLSLGISNCTVIIFKGSCAKTRAAVFFPLMLGSFTGQESIN